jgi:interleukin-1 receptor-associated kinase 1
VNAESWETAFPKEDVHGFRVVLLELITGMDCSKITDSSKGTLNEWIIHFLNSSDLCDAIG